MAPTRIDETELAKILLPGGLTLISACSAESDLFDIAIRNAGDELGDMQFSGVFVPGLNTKTYLHGDKTRVLTFFVTPELRQHRDRVEFLPLCYNDILAEFRTRKPDAALVMLSSPDDDGFCSFGSEVDFLADCWKDIPVRIAHINPLMPQTSGRRGPHIDELTAVIEREQPLRATLERPADKVSLAIADHVAKFIRDGATLQTGLGNTPGAILRALRGRRNLRIHSGLIGDAVLDLIDAGALAEGDAATVGVAIGSERLYQSISGRPFSFQPVSVTHNAQLIGAYDDFVAINSALEVDFFGQAYAELTPNGLLSGPGGASDYARAARLSKNGLRIVALPATGAKGSFSRIVVPGAAAGPVALGRMDIDIVATEFGAADLRGQDIDARAAALMAIAAPAFRGGLMEEWKKYSARL
ncbi:MAG: acetyl-CoA hydrolase/transferase C-terminal domain-containing protein [Amphiplicatus sp.]